MRYLLRSHFVAALLLTVFAFAVPTFADEQGVSGCQNCNGYTFDATLSGGTNGIYTLVYTITNANPLTATSTAAYVYNWSLTLFGNSSTVTSATLNSAISGGTDYASDFTALAGKSNNGNNNCNSSVGGALCVQSLVGTGSPLPVLNPGQSITFNVTVNCSSCTELANWIFLASGNCVSNVQANCYAISTTGTAVAPEPSVLLLLGASGLFGLCTFARNKLRA